MTNIMEEQYYEVTEKGVSPIMINPEELHKDHDWMMFHSFQGRIIFENFSRALLCFFERQTERQISIHN